MKKATAQHDLKSVQDFVDVVTDGNIEVLIADFATFLDMAVTTKDLSHLGVSMETDVFRWNDDGEAGVKAVNVTFNQNSEV